MRQDESQQKYLQGTLERVEALIGLERYDLALKDIEEVYPLNKVLFAPLYVEALVGRADLEAHNGDSTSAIQDYELACQIMPDAAMTRHIQDRLGELMPRLTVSPMHAIEQAPIEVACPGCGKSVSADWIHCPYCEYQLTDRSLSMTEMKFPKLSSILAILKQSTSLYQDASLDTLPVGQLQIGQMVKLGNIKKLGTQQWVQVSLPDGKSGYIAGDAQVFRIQKVSLVQEAVEVYLGPSVSSGILQRIKKGEKFFIVNSQNDWLEIRDLAGKAGFINSQTLVKSLAYISKAIAGKNILYGALWFVGGCVVTFASISNASSGGSYLITWGAIIFGGIQLLQGLSQYGQADD